MPLDELQNIAENIWEFLVIAARAITKIVTGFIIVPLGILMDHIKPEWEKASRVVKFFTGILLVPTMAFLWFAAPWWDDFEVID